MSTEVLEKTNAVDLQPLVDFINDEGFDILDIMSADRFAHIVQVIGNRINFYKKIVTDWSFKAGGKMYQIRVNNHHNGFVSVSNEDGNTGVSNTSYRPWYRDEDENGEPLENPWFVGQMNLASMINEAWYLCNN